MRLITKADGPDSDKTINCLLTFHLAEYPTRPQQSRCVSVSMGLLCVVLLAGNVGQFIFCEFSAVTNNLNKCVQHRPPVL